MGFSRIKNLDNSLFALAKAERKIEFFRYSAEAAIFFQPTNQLKQVAIQKKEILGNLPNQRVSASN
jgi:hypothetical protein